MEGRPPDEPDLVQRAQAGDDDAFTELLRRHQQIGFRVAYLITRSEEEAEDAAQEGFIRAYRAMARFRPEASFRPWLLAIVANQARNRRRAAGRRAHHELALSRDPASGEAAPSPEAAALDFERRRALLEAVGRLPEKDRLVIACRYFLELSEEETATALRVPAGTIKSRLSRALDRLSDHLDRGRL